MENTHKEILKGIKKTKILEQDVEEQKKNIEALKISAKNLEDMSYFVKSSNMGQIELSTVGGTCIGINLFNIGKIAVAKWFATKGALLEPHILKEREWVIVYEGKMRVTSFDENGNVCKIEELNSSDYCFWEPNIPHESLFLENTSFVAITIPASEGWPKSDK